MVVFSWKDWKLIKLPYWPKNVNCHKTIVYDKIVCADWIPESVYNSSLDGLFN